MRGAKTSMFLQRVTETLDSMQANIPTWQDLRIIAGVLTVMSKQEQALYDKKTTVALYKFTFDKQYGMTISEKDRFRWGANIYDIVDINQPLFNNRHMEAVLEYIE